MPLIFNPDSQSYEWDYSNGPPDIAPWDPQTGQPLGMPPNQNYDQTQPDNWDTTAPWEAGYDPTWGGYSPDGNPNGTGQNDDWLKSVYIAQGWPLDGSDPNHPAVAGSTTGSTGTGGTSTGGVTGSTSAGGGTRSASSGGTGSFSSSGFSGLPSDFGGVPAPFGETYSTRARPDYLSGEYKPLQWGESFSPITAESLKADPGYQARLNAGVASREATAAQRGSLLGGGQQKAIERYGQEFAANEYGTANDRAFKTYQQKYGEFSDRAGLDLGARATNESAYQSDVSGDLNQFNTRYKTYLDAITNKRNAENDYWNRNMDLNNSGLTAGGLIRP